MKMIHWLCIRSEATMLFFFLLAACLSSADSSSKPPFCKICDCDFVFDLYNVVCTSAAVDHVYDLYEPSHWVAPDEEFYPIRELTVQNTRIFEIYRIPESEILKLVVKNCSVDFIEESAFANLENLEELVLSYNILGRIPPEAFEGASKSLASLYIDHNRFKRLNPELFTFIPELELLSVAHNPLETLDSRTRKAIGFLENLRKLDLSYTRLSTLTTFLTNPKLKYLNLSGNKFTQIPAELATLPKLNILDFSDNPVVALDAENGANLTTLISLRMNNMANLSAIKAGSLSELYNLKELYLSNNPELDYIDKDAFLWTHKHKRSWTSLRKLVLNNNTLNFLDMELLDWDLLEEIDLRHNPWDCSCQNNWMIGDLVPNILLKRAATIEVMCSSPSSLKGQTLVQIYKEGRMKCWTVHKSFLVMLINFKKSLIQNWVSSGLTVVVIIATVIIFVLRYKKRLG